MCPDISKYIIKFFISKRKTNLRIQLKIFLIDCYTNFLNEENEEELIYDYQINIHSNNINIAKFKTVSEYNTATNKAFDFMNVIIIILIFLALNLIYC